MIIGNSQISPPQLKKMKQLHDQGVPMNQILSQIYTTAGETLAKAISDYNNNLVYSDPNNKYQSSITDSDLNKMMNTYGASGGSSFTASGWQGALILLIIIFFMWQSEPGGFANNSKGSLKLKNKID